MDVLGILEEYGVEGQVSGNEMHVLCPFHNDTTPSCSINTETGKFKCFACEAKGDLYSFVAGASGVSRTTIVRHLEGGEATPTISSKVILKWNEALRGLKKWKDILLTKGITDAVIEKYLIGFDGTRITIPIYDKSGKPINVRKYLPNASKYKFLNMKGCNGSDLFPIESLEENTLVITEGECKAMMLCSMGITAITQTGGAGTWPEGLSDLFKDKTVYIVYDIDKSGRTNAQKLAGMLYTKTKAVYVVDLPLDNKQYPKGDITNYVVDEKADKAVLNGLFKATNKWEPKLIDVSLDTEILQATLGEATDARFYNKIIQTRAVVSAKDTAPYMVPFKCEVHCTKDKDYCAFCKAFKQSVFQLDKTAPALLCLVGVPTTTMTKGLMKGFGIPKSCDVCSFKVLESINIEEIRIMPQLEISTNAVEHVVRQAFYVGHGIETNITYDIKARVCPQPDTQYATLIVYEATPVTDSLATFSLENPEPLRIFQSKEATYESISEKLGEIYDDFSANVTRIYKRSELHLFYDLIYHSALYIPFQGRSIKGWLEGLVVGDSGQGKSETISQIQRHYGLGEKVDVKSCSAVGLIGGLQETSKRWFVTWGIIPLNDRRLVVLEEIKGIPAEVIAKLTEVRSSGIAEISRVEKAKTNARTRLIWISNPRSDRQVLSYNFGVEAIKELIGNLEDIRRFDMAIMVTSTDVDHKWLNISEKERPKIKHVHTAELCRQLVLWGWSRKANDIEVTPEATSEILRVASEMGQKYSSQIPLVEAADQRIKIARLSTALAIRLFSSPDGIKVVVQKCHVEFIHRFLEGLYSSTGSGYADYSRMVKNENTIHDPEDIKTKLREIPYARDAIRALLDTESFSVFDIADWTEMELDRCRELIGLLVRKNAIKRGKKNYEKTPAFIALLKVLKSEKLENDTAYDKVKGEEF